MKDAVSWAAGHNKGHLRGYRYRRVNEGSYICWNPKCTHARNGHRVEASRLDRAHNYWVQNLCPCDAGSIMSLRCRRKPRLTERIQAACLDRCPSISTVVDDENERKRIRPMDQNDNEMGPNSKVPRDASGDGNAQKKSDGIEGRPSMAADDAESSDSTSEDEIQWVEDDVSKDGRVRQEPCHQ